MREGLVQARALDAAGASTAAQAVVTEAKEVSPVEPSLETQAMHGSLWTIIGFVAAQFLRFGSNLALTRLLKPDVFGLMAIVFTFFFGVNLFSDFGLGAAIVQNKRGDDRRFLNTAWTIQAARGFGIFLVMSGLALPVSRFYHHSELLWALPACGLGAVISGFNSTSIHTLHRHMRIATLTRLSLMMQIVSMMVTISAAVFTPTIWALIIGQLCGQFFYMVVSHCLIPAHTLAGRRSNWFDWDATAFNAMLHFGKWIFVGTILYYLQSQADRIVFDKIFGNLTILGIYVTALQLAQLPTQLIANLASSTLLPMFVRGAQFDGERVFQEMGGKVLAVRRFILPAGIVAILTIVLGGPVFFHVLYRGEYRHAGWMIRWMAPGVWFCVLQLSADQIFQAAGKLKTLAVINGINLLFTLIGCAAGAWFFELRGFILGLAVGNLAGQIVLQVNFAIQGISLYRQDIAYTLLLGMLVGGGLAMTYALQRFTPSLVVPGLVASIFFVGTSGIWAGRRVLRRIR